MAPVDRHESEDRSFASGGSASKRPASRFVGGGRAVTAYRPFPWVGARVISIALLGGS